MDRATEMRENSFPRTSSTRSGVWTMGDGNHDELEVFWETSTRASDLKQAGGGFSSTEIKLQTQLDQRKVLLRRGTHLGMWIGMSHSDEADGVY